MTDALLFDPARHEALTDRPWSAASARAAIDRIVACTLAEYRPGAGWTAHPLDDPDAPGQCCEPLYHGSAGVLLALRHLARRSVKAPLPGDAVDLLAAHRVRLAADLADYRHGSASFLLGTTGIDLLRWRLTGDDTLLAPLHAAVAGNLHNPVREQLWGNPGTVLAAITLAEATGDPRWADLVRAAADALEAELAWDASLDAWIWQQDLYGRQQRLLGAGHGFAGNVFPFLRGAAWLPTDQVERVLAKALQTLQTTALRDGALLNWLPDAGGDADGAAPTGSATGAASTRA